MAKNNIGPSASSSAPTTACATGWRSASPPSSWRLHRRPAGRLPHRQRLQLRRLGRPVRPQWFKLLTFVTLLGLFYHAWVGMRDIWMDYVKPSACA
jgi:hypothetical protein